LTAKAGAIACGPLLEDGGLAAIGICPLDGLNTELDDEFEYSLFLIISGILKN